MTIFDCEEVGWLPINKGKKTNKSDIEKQYYYTAVVDATWLLLQFQNL